MEKGTCCSPWRLPTSGESSQNWKLPTNVPSATVQLLLLQTDTCVGSILGGVVNFPFELCWRRSGASAEVAPLASEKVFPSAASLPPRLRLESSAAHAGSVAGAGLREKNSLRGAERSRTSAALIVLTTPVLHEHV